MADSILQHQLEKLAADRYPLHMPGHKRHLAPAPGLSCYAWDMTEIAGADAVILATGSTPVISCPFTRMLPSSKSTMRLIILSRVVLPDPEGPISTIVCPAATVSETSLTATDVP